MENEKKIKIGVYFFILPVAGRNEKKRCILMFLGIFPIACVKKKEKEKECIVFLGDFPAA